MNYNSEQLEGCRFPTLYYSIIRLIQLKYPFKRISIPSQKMFQNSFSKKVPFRYVGL